MLISLIAAIDRNRGIGLQNHIPWRLPADRRRFRQFTMGRHFLMGRKTFESIGKPLDGRVTIVLTRNIGYHPTGCLVAHSLSDALALAQEGGETELFVCGGGEIYSQTLPLADRMYLTLVETVAEADAWFPAWNDAEWLTEETAHFDMDAQNPYPFVFCTLSRLTKNVISV